MSGVSRNDIPRYEIPLPRHFVHRSLSGKAFYKAAVKSVLQETTTFGR